MPRCFGRKSCRRWALLGCRRQAGVLVASRRPPAAWRTRRVARDCLQRSRPRSHRRGRSRSCRRISEHGRRPPIRCWTRSRAAPVRLAAPGRPVALRSCCALRPRRPLQAPLRSHRPLIALRPDRADWPQRPNGPRWSQRPGRPYLRHQQFDGALLIRSRRSSRRTLASSAAARPPAPVFGSRGRRGSPARWSASAAPAQAAYMDQARRRLRAIADTRPNLDWLRIRLWNARAVRSAGHGLGAR